jgi:Concanavalin A-like lectin/glucanases superfamily
MKPRYIVTATVWIFVVAVTAGFINWTKPRQTSLLNERTKQTIGEVTKLTGARTRMVWSEIADDEGDTFGKRKTHKLIGFDTHDGKGIREILPEKANYRKPLLTPKGDRVVYSDWRETKVFIVNWDGTRHRELLSGGLATDVWMDPSTGIEWVYVARGTNEELGAIRRYQLDNTNISEDVWTQTRFTRPDSDIDSFQLSADGTRASGLFPWPECGVATLPDGAFEKTVRGCWVSMAPDNSYVSWVFDGPHRNVTMYANVDGEKRSWDVNIGTAPGIGAHEVYHPRWSNHVNLFTITGPYKVGEGEVKIKGGGPAVEVYIGRFADDLKQVKKWVQITNNERAEIFPDLWVEGGEKAELASFSREQRAPSTNSQAQSSWPVNRTGLLFLWDNDAQPNEIDIGNGRKIACKAEPRGLARYGRFNEMDLGGGAFVAPDAGKRFLTRLRQSGEFAIEALVTPKPNAAGSIISFSGEDKEPNLRVSQTSGRLFIELRNAAGELDKLELGAIETGKPTHLVITCKRGEIVWSINRDAKQMTSSVDLNQWVDNHHLVFGDDWRGGNEWEGRLEGVAIYNRSMGRDEAAAKHNAIATRLKSRTELPRLVVRPRLIEAAEVPAPEAIAPYRRALVINEYEVEEVVEGTYEHKRILVAEWGVMDGKRIAVDFAKAGRRIAVEPFDAHPELRGERIDMDRLLSALEKDGSSELDLYYAVDG